MNKKIKLAECSHYDNPLTRHISRYCSHLHIPDVKRDKILSTGRFIEHIYDSTNKSIVDVPCGGGKSVWAQAKCMQTLENPCTTGLIVVVDRIETAEKRLNTLLELGYSGQDIGIYHSYNEKLCHELSGKTIRFKNIAKKENRHICKGCETNTQCNYYLRRSNLKKKVVFMCHEGFCRLYERKRIPKDKCIIIDEEILNLYCDTFTKARLEAFIALEPVNSPSPNIDIIKNIMRSLLAVMDDRLSILSTIQWTNLINDDIKDDALAELTGSSSSSEDDDLDLAIELHKELLNQFAYVFATGYDVYIWAEEKEVIAARNRISFDIPNRILMLNGSAQLSRYIYNNDEMHIWSCSGLRDTLPNLKLTSIQVNPTQKKLKDVDIINSILQYSKEKLGDSGVFFTINKKNGSLIELIKQHFPNVKDKDIGKRGSIIGSNEWTEYRLGVMASSLFNNMSFYALSASLRNKREYPQHTLFNYNAEKLIFSPKFTKHFKLLNEDVNDEFQRHAVYELHQHIMRLNCRVDNLSNTEVVVLLPNIEMVKLLHDLMPGFQIDGNDKQIKLANHLLNSCQPIQNSEIFDMFDLEKSGQNLLYIKKIMDMFGWVLVQVEGSKGNVKEWVRQSGELNINEFYDPNVKISLPVTKALEILIPLTNSEDEDNKECQ